MRNKELRKELQMTEKANKQLEIRLKDLNDLIRTKNTELKDY